MAAVVSCISLTSPAPLRAQTQVKGNVRKWSGLGESGEELEAKKAKMVERALKHPLPLLKSAMDCFAVDRSSKTGGVDKKSLAQR